MSAAALSLFLIGDQQPNFWVRVEKTAASNRLKRGAKIQVLQSQREQDLSHDSGVEFGLHEMTTKDTRPNYLFFCRIGPKLFSAGMHFSMKGLSEVQKAARRGDFNDGCLALWERAREWKRFQGCFYVIISDAGRWDADQNRGVEVSADRYKRDTETPFGRPASGPTDRPTINRQSTCEKILLCIAFFIHPLEHSPRNEWRDKKYSIIPRRARARHHSTSRGGISQKHQNLKRLFYLVELITPTPIYFVLAAGCWTKTKRKGFCSRLKTIYTQTYCIANIL